MVSRRLTSFLLLALLLVALPYVASQVEEDEVVVTGEGQQDFNEEAREPTAEDMMQDESFQQRIRDLYVSCIVTSRQKIHSLGDQLIQILKVHGHDDSIKEQPAIYKKMLAEHIYTCAIYSTQNPDTPQQIIKSLQDRSFKIADWDVIYMGNDYKKYEEVDYVVELSEDEIHILEFVKQFDEAMKENRKQNGLPEEESEGDLPNMSSRPSYEPKFGGFSLNSFSKGFQSFYFILIISALAAAIYYCYSRIEKEDEVKVKKSKKDNKKKSS